MSARVLEIIILLRATLRYVVVVLRAPNIAENYVLVDTRVWYLRSFHKPIFKVQDKAQLVTNERRVQNCPSIVTYCAPFIADSYLFFFQR